jgi:excisionase family DNA binding protein
MGDVTQTGSPSITVAQAAEILGKSRWTVVRRIKNGELGAEKLGDNTAAWLLNRAEVERFARNQTAEVA